MVKQDSLTYYVPETYVQAASETNNLAEFAAEVYRDLYAAWARKRRLPDPPLRTIAWWAEGRPCRATDARALGLAQRTS